MRHVVLQAAGGRWHAVYKLAAGSYGSVGDAPTQRAAQELADEANKAYAAEIKLIMRDAKLRGLTFIEPSADI
jgi:hypothetical protein